MGSDRKALDFWEERYRTNRIPWDRGASSPAMSRWLDSCDLQQCRIVIPGCGYGYEVVELARRGFDVTGIDFAPSALAALKNELQTLKVNARVIEADVLKWKPEQLFDAIYEQTCLCALPPKLWKRYIERLDHWLKPGGKLFALFMQTNQAGGPPYHCDMKEMRDLFSAERWAWPNEPLIRVPHPVGFHELAGCLVKRP
jgi:SAM-dependent methyltransferase